MKATIASYLVNAKDARITFTPAALLIFLSFSDQPLPDAEQARASGRFAIASPDAELLKRDLDSALASVIRDL